MSGQVEREEKDAGQRGQPGRRSLQNCQSAVAESTIRTLKEERISLTDWRDIDELVAALERWARTFNEDRPHQALGWQTPAERRAGLFGPSERRAA
jgi:transposase InsO family protein